MTNNLVIAEATVLESGICTCLLSRSYLFSLEEYFKRIRGELNTRQERCGVYEKNYKKWEDGDFSCFQRKRLC